MKIKIVFVFFNNKIKQKLKDACYVIKLKNFNIIKMVLVYFDILFIFHYIFLR